jgi:GAF domain-containing protein
MNLLDSLQSFFDLSMDGEGATLTNWRERVYSMLLSTAAPFMVVLYIFNLIAQARQGEWTQIGIDTFALSLFLFITYTKRLPHNLRIGIGLAVLFSLGISTALSKAMIGDSRVWMLAVSVLASLFIGGRVGLLIAGINFLIWAGIGLMFRHDIILNYPQEELVAAIDPDNFSIWMNTGLTSLIVSSVIVLSFAVMLNNLNDALQRRRSLTKELEDNTDQLSERTNVLKQYSNSLEASARISRALASILDPNRLLYEAARRICTSFDMLHVGIFLISADKSEVTLRASSGGRGKTIPTLGYRVRLGEGLIDWVIKNTRPYAASLPDEETPAPLHVKLSDTRSYAVLPMQTRDELLGVIVLQSQNPKAFDSNILTTLQILGDQIATLLSNARLFAERESALEAEKRAYRELTRSDWADFTQTQKLKGYRQDPEGLKSLEPHEPDQRRPDDSLTESIPITVRGELVGYIDAKKRPDTPWSPTDKEILETMANRLESALDTARLYQETQQSALYERIVSDVSARMRETLDIETMLKTAAREIQQALNLAEAEIRLGSTTESSDRSEKEK